MRVFACGNRILRQKKTCFLFEKQPYTDSSFEIAKNLDWWAVTKRCYRSKFFFQFYQVDLFCTVRSFYDLALCRLRLGAVLQTTCNSLRSSACFQEAMKLHWCRRARILLLGKLKSDLISTVICDYRFTACRRHETMQCRGLGDNNRSVADVLLDVVESLAGPTRGCCIVCAKDATFKRASSEQQKSLWNIDACVVRDNRAASATHWMYYAAGISAECPR